MPFGLLWHFKDAVLSLDSFIPHDAVYMSF